MQKSHGVSRRSFVRRALAGTAGLIGGGALARPRNLLAFFHSSQQATPTPEFRTLGRTGMKFTSLGFGAMRTTDPAVIRRAVDKGVNYIDTARGYMGGRNEEYVGQAIGDIRTKIHISTKFGVGSKAKMVGDVEASLRALGTDYVDILLLHGLRSPRDLHNEDAIAVLEAAKKSGKTRAIGFSVHGNMAALLREAADMQYYDMVLAAYNFTHEQDVTTAIAEATKAGIGVIAMKTQAGGYTEKSMGNLNPHQAALKWVLSNPNVTSTIPSMVSFQQVDDNVQVMGSNFGWLDRKTLYRYGEAVDSKLCRLCDTCLSQCPYGVRVSDINRSVMYADGYGDEALARESYQRIEPDRNASRCNDCDECVVQCRYGINVTANLKRAIEVFA
ncbi:MAG: aldo/keto reductase [Calditrichota bacterium]